MECKSCGVPRIPEKCRKCWSDTLEDHAPDGELLSVALRAFRESGTLPGTIAGLEFAARKMGLAPSAILYTEDDPENENDLEEKEYREFPDPNGDGVAIQLYHTPEGKTVATSMDLDASSSFAMWLLPASEK